MSGPTIRHDAAAERHFSPTTLSSAQRRLVRLGYSPAEAAEVIGVSRALVYELIAEGRLKARKLGARTIVEAAELERFIAALPIRES